MPLLIAVDLGSHAVKVSTWRTAGRGIERVGRFTTPVPQGGTPPSLASKLVALDALLEDNPSWTGSAAILGVSIGAHEVVFRPMEMPFADRAQVEQTLPFAIEGEVPFDLDEMTLAWRFTRIGERSRVMAALTRRENLRGLLDALKQRKVDPRDVVPDGELLGAYGRPGQSVAVIDVGHTHTVVAVVIDGEVRACRAIDVGGFAFTRAIQTALGCEWEQAEALKHGQRGARPVGDDDETDPGGRARSGYASLPEAARAAVDGAIGQLLAEIRSTLIRFEDTMQLDVSEVRLCGGGARIPELRGYLAQDLGLPVDRVEDPDGEKVPGPFAASHALARSLAGLAAVRPIDLRVGDLAFRGGVNVLRAVLTYGGAGAAFFAIAAVVIFTVQYISLLREASDVNARVVSVVTDTFPDVDPATIAQPSDGLLVMARRTAETVKRSEALPPATPGKPPTVDTLYALVGVLPPHEQVPVELVNLDLLPELIMFEGETSGFAQSAQIEEALKASDRFQSGNKDSESRTTDNKVKFKFSIPLGKSGEEAG